MTKYNGIELELKYDTVMAHSKLEKDENTKWFDLMLSTDKTKLIQNIPIVKGEDYIIENFEKFAKDNGFVHYDNEIDSVKYFMGKANDSDKLKVLDCIVNDGLSTIQAIKTFNNMQTLTSPYGNKSMYLFLTEQQLQGKTINNLFEEFVKTYKEPKKRYNSVFREISELNSVANMNYQICNGGIGQYFDNGYNKMRKQFHNQDVMQMPKENQVEMLEKLIKFGEDVYPQELQGKINELSRFVYEFDRIEWSEWNDLDLDAQIEIMLNKFEQHHDWVESAITEGHYNYLLNNNNYIGSEFESKMKEEFDSLNDDGERVNSFGETIESRYGLDWDDIDDSKIYQFKDYGVYEITEYYELEEVIDLDQLAEDIINNGETDQWDIDNNYFTNKFNEVIDSYDISNLEEKYFKNSNLLESLLENYSQYLVKANSLDKIQFKKQEISETQEKKQLNHDEEER